MTARPTWHEIEMGCWDDRDDDGPPEEWLAAMDDLAVSTFDGLARVADLFDGFANPFDDLANLEREALIRAAHATNQSR
jgi:hypothetical protein